MKAKLALENGTVFTGEAFGARGEVAGEAVFNTSLSGYQEIFTDPSYARQIVAMTSPLIGNYGANSEDVESSRVQVAGVVVREYSDFYSNFRGTMSLGDWLRQHGVIAVEGIDTRMLTRMLRTQGAMRAVLSTETLEDALLVQMALSAPSMAGQDLATKVTCAAPYHWDGSEESPFAPQVERGGSPKQHFRVMAYDYGIKRNILRRLSSYGCDVTVLPLSFPPEEVLQGNPDGIFLSNGPGDPAAVHLAIRSIRELIGRKPIFGICLGHQLLALALGGRTFKLKFGHRGSNHPVKNLQTGRIEITSQNHGFAVDTDSLEKENVELTHVNLNDGTNEGFRHRELPVFSVQYHPEASPGPHDSDYLFRDFLTMMKTGAPVNALSTCSSP